VRGDVYTEFGVFFVVQIAVPSAPPLPSVMTGWAEDRQAAWAPFSLAAST